MLASIRKRDERYKNCIEQVGWIRLNSFVLIADAFTYLRMNLIAFRDDPEQST